MKNSDKPGVIELADGVPASIEDIADDSKIKLDTVKLGVQTFMELGMVIADPNDNGAISIKNIRKHQAIDQIEYQRELGRQRVKKFRDKKKALEIANNSTDVTHYTVTCNAPVTNREDKIRTDKDKSNITAAKAAAPKKNNPITKYIVDRLWQYLKEQDRLPATKAASNRTYWAGYTIIDTLINKDNPVWVMAVIGWAAEDKWWQDKISFTSIEKAEHQFRNLANGIINKYVNIYEKEMADEFGLEQLKKYI